MYKMSSEARKLTQIRKLLVKHILETKFTQYLNILMELMLCG